MPTIDLTADSSTWTNTTGRRCSLDALDAVANGQNGYEPTIIPGEGGGGWEINGLTYGRGQNPGEDFGEEHQGVLVVDPDAEYAAPIIYIGGTADVIGPFDEDRDYIMVGAGGHASETAGGGAGGFQRGTLPADTEANIGVGDATAELEDDRQTYINDTNGTALSDNAHGGGDADGNTPGVGGDNQENIPWAVTDSIGNSGSAATFAGGNGGNSGSWARPLTGGFFIDPDDNIYIDLGAGDQFTVYFYDASEATTAILLQLFTGPGSPPISDYLGSIDNWNSGEVGGNGSESFGGGGAAAANENAAGAPGGTPAGGVNDVNQGGTGGDGGTNPTDGALPGDGGGGLGYGFDGSVGLGQTGRASFTYTEITTSAPTADFWGGMQRAFTGGMQRA